MNLLRILIVEDHDEFRASLKEILLERLPQAVVDEAADGSVVLERIGKQAPDLILMDINMPGESGLQLTRKIKRLHPDIVIVILTSYDLPEYKDAAFEYGASHFLSKSCTSGHEIAELIRSLFPGRPGPAGTPEDVPNAVE